MLHRLQYALGTWPIGGTGTTVQPILGHLNTEAASKVTSKAGENGQRPDRPGRGLGLRPSVSPRGNLGGPSLQRAALKTSCAQKCQGSLSTGSPAGHLNAVVLETVRSCAWWLNVQSGLWIALAWGLQGEAWPQPKRTLEKRASPKLWGEGVGRWRTVELHGRENLSLETSEGAPQMSRCPQGP